MGTDKKKSLFSIYLPAVITAVLIGIGFLIYQRRFCNRDLSRSSAFIAELCTVGDFKTAFFTVHLCFLYSNSNSYHSNLQ